MDPPWWSSIFTERSNTQTIFRREEFPEIQRDLYHILSGVELPIQTRGETREIGPGTPGFDLIAAGADSARDQDSELADAIQTPSTWMSMWS